MEIFRGFIPFQDAGRGAETGVGAGAGVGYAAGAGPSGVEGALALLREAGVTAVGDAALLGFEAAAD
ncbi:hypothetical protein J2X01_003597, partial [Arthrobacter ginsengisoli]